jgi:zinc protease
MHRSLVAPLLLALTLACGPAVPPDEPKLATSSAPAVVTVDELDQPLPLDARITKGTLDNGLTYYVLPHKKPEQRAQLWLAVNAGSVLEDEDQRGLAHFVEHMGFNGTKRFPKQELIAFLEKAGVRFGADLNAYTSFDETVYKLQLPTDDPTFLTRGLSVLRDWADGISFDAEEVEKERGVVLEEWRLGRGARMRLFDKQAPVVFHGSKYAERITIGKPEIIKNASRETLMRYYRDWYRPDLMAVIAVGDFDPKAIEASIKAEFGSMPGRTEPKPRPRVYAEVPPHAETLVSIESDRELPTTSVSIVNKVPHKPEASARDYRRSIGDQLYSIMLNARFEELRRDPNAPFLGAFAGSGGLVRTIDAFRQNALVKEDGVERGLAALLEETVRVERHGFTASEFERAKKQLLRQFEEAATERDKTDSGEFTAEIVRNFLENEAMPGREAELALAQRFLPSFKLEELNGLAKEASLGSRVINVSGPKTMLRPTEQALLGVEKSVRARELAPYVDAAPSEPLMANLPSPGKISKTKTIGELGITEWTFENGVRVIVKPTDFANDEIKLSAFSPGGTSQVKDADFIPAQFADEVVGLGGVGPFDALMLRKALAGKVVSLRATISELEEGLSGSAASADLETLFQLTYLSFTAPRKDEKAFAAWRTREIEAAKNRRLSPERLFQEELLSFSTQDHPRRRPTTPETIEKVDLGRAFDFYNDRFSDASDFTFLFVGNVDLDKLKSLSERYLGSLKTRARKESWRDIKVSLLKGGKTKVIEKGTEPKSMVSLTFHGAESWSADSENDVRMLTEVLRHRLRQTLREDLGGVYGVQVGGQLRRRPRAEYQFSVSFGCSPENVDKLKQAVFDEIKAIQESGVSAEMIAKIKETRRRAQETDLKDNGFWLRELERAYTFGDDPREIPNAQPMIDKISSERTQRAAKKYLRAGEFILAVLKPEAGATP